MHVPICLEQMFLLYGEILNTQEELDFLLNSVRFGCIGLGIQQSKQK